MRVLEVVVEIEIVAQQSNDRLAYGEASAGQNYEHPLARLNETIHLATHVDLIKSRIGPRVRRQHQPFLRHNAQAICHSCPRDKKEV